MCRPFLFAVMMAVSASVQASDLVKIYRAALVTDPQYQVALALQEANIEKEVQGRAGLLPSITLNSNVGMNRQHSQLRSIEAEPVEARFRSTSWTIQLSQPLYRPKSWAIFSQGELTTQSAGLQLQEATQELLLRSAKLYIELILADEALQTALALKAATEEQLQLVKNSYQVGMAPIVDVQEAQARLALAKAQEIYSRQDLLVKRKAMSLFTGHVMPSNTRIRSAFTIQAAHIGVRESWVETAERRNFQVRLAELALEVAKKDVDAHQADHLPTVDLVASYGNAVTGNNVAYGIARPGTDVDTSAIGVQIVIPIFSGGATSSRLRESLSLQEKASAELSKARQSAALEAEQAFLETTYGASQIEAYTSALSSSESSLEAMKIGYEVGLRISSDVLNSQRQYFETKQKLAKAKGDTLLAGLRLKAAIGVLEEADLTEISQFFE